MNNYDVSEDLYLDLLINSKKKSQKEINRSNEYSNKLHKQFNKYETLILKNEIILSNFEEFISYLDEAIKNDIYIFCKQITHKSD